MVVAPDDPRLDRCGFAKLQGEGVEVYARKTEILIGRQSKSTALGRGAGREHECVQAARKNCLQPLKRYAFGSHICCMRKVAACRQFQSAEEWHGRRNSSS